MNNILLYSAFCNASSKAFYSPPSSGRGQGERLYFFINVVNRSFVSAMNA